MANYCCLNDTEQYSEKYMKKAGKREHLIKVAAEIFNRYGYHAAGVDLVIAEAGIAKTTLYRHFKSKDELIVAALTRIDEEFREAMREAVDKSASEPKDKILATFDFLEAWFKDDVFYGCPFMGAASEHDNRDHPVFQAAILHKRLSLAYLEELAYAAGLNDPKELAAEINLLHEGAASVAHVSGKPEVAAMAKSIAEKLIEAASI